MKDYKYLCEIMGLCPALFYLDGTEDEPVVCSDFYMARNIAASIMDDEEKVLTEAISLLEHGLEGLTSEVQTMKHFLETYYGSGTSTENNEGTSAS